MTNALSLCACQGMHIYRSHDCGALGLSDAGQRVRLCGWVHRKRDHGGLLFVDLRDHYGLTQCVLEPANPCFEAAGALRPESVIRVEGEVARRPPDTVNEELPTGLVELRVATLEVLSKADDLPLPVFGEPEYPEETRLRYRFLDLRREGMHRNMILRSEIIASLRRRMVEQGFLECQTPILTASSPEGARDFLVPSRLHPGQFYALPQAPQQFKQLIMMAGFDRYFQIAPCFRDEDARADRSPGEFYQLDIEMSFVEQEDVLKTVEGVLHGVFEEFAHGRRVSSTPFPRIPYGEAMLRYGTDKPDLRNPLEICDVTSCFLDPEVTFQAFRKVIDKGGVVRGIPAPGAARQPRRFFDALNDWARQDMAAPGLGYILFETQNGTLHGKGPIAKFLPSSVVERLAHTAGVKAEDALFFACDTQDKAALLAGAARTKIANNLDLIPSDVFEFCWVVDFPMYAWNPQEQKIDFSHNPFSMPQGGMEALATTPPLDILGYQYDIVCNGVELSSGAIRNHRPDIMLKAFEIAGYGRDEVEARFGGLLRAFRYGAPPHGGIAPGIDRIVMLLCGADSLRDVVMFPMNQQAQDLLMGAPSSVSQQQLQALSLRLMMPKK